MSRKTAVLLGITMTALLVSGLCHAEVSSISWSPTEMTLRSTANTEAAAAQEAIRWLVGTQLLHADIFDLWQPEISAGVLANPNRYITSTKAQQDGFYMRVDAIQVVRDLVTTMFGDLPPRVSVATYEVILRRPPVPDPAVETAMNRSFLDYGFQMVDLDQAARSDVREALLQEASGDTWAKVNLNTTLNADILIVGESVAEEMAGGGFQARTEVKAVEVATGRVLGSFGDPHQTLTGPTVDVVAKEALQRGAEVSAPRLVAAMLNAFGKPIIKLRVNKARSFGEINAIRTGLQSQLPGTTVSIATVDLRGTAMAVLEITTKENPMMVAAVLEELPGVRMRVDDFACRYIVGTLQ